MQNDQRDRSGTFRPPTAVHGPIPRCTVLSVDVALLSRANNLFRLRANSVTVTKLVTVTRTKQVVLGVYTIFKNPVLAETTAGLQIPAARQNRQDLAPFQLLESGIDGQSLKTEIASIISLPIEHIFDAYFCTRLQTGLVALPLRYPNAYTGRAMYELGDEVDIERFHIAWVAVHEGHAVLRNQIR